ncbi:hypothetical protein ACG7TL_001455 [Trametes sanguinea]
MTSRSWPTVPHGSERGGPSAIPLLYKTLVVADPFLQQQVQAFSLHHYRNTHLDSVDATQQLSKMFPRLTTYVTVASVAVLAVATPNVKRWNTPTSTPASTKTITVTATAPAATETAGDCSTGPIQCCNSVQSASDPVASLLLGLLGIVVEGVDVLLGLNCSPISVIGVGGGNCDANVVCCQNNNVGGLISIGCVPVIL